MGHKLRLGRERLEWRNVKADWFISRKHYYIHTLLDSIRTKNRIRRNNLVFFSRFSCVLDNATCFQSISSFPYPQAFHYWMCWLEFRGLYVRKEKLQLCLAFSEGCYFVKYFFSAAFASHGVSTEAGHLQSQGWGGEWGLLTTSSQRQYESERSCCSRRCHHRPDCCWSLCLLPSHSSRGTCAGMTEAGTWRVPGAQHPLLSGQNPRFQRFNAVALLLASARGVLDN